MSNDGPMAAITVISHQILIKRVVGWNCGWIYRLIANLVFLCLTAIY